VQQAQDWPEKIEIGQELGWAWI